MFVAGWGGELNKIFWAFLQLYHMYELIFFFFYHVVFIIFQMLRWIVTCVFGFLDIHLFMVTTRVTSTPFLINLDSYILKEGCGFLYKTGITFSIIC